MPEIDGYNAVGARAKVVCALVVLGLLTVGSNIAETIRQAQSAPFAYRPLYTYGTSDLRQVALDHGPTANRRFQFYLDLREVAQNGHLTTPADVALYGFEEQLFGLSRLQGVTVRDYDDGLPPPATARDWMARARYTGDVEVARGSTVEYAIVPDATQDSASHARSFTLRRADEIVLIIEDTLSGDELGQ